MVVLTYAFLLYYNPNSTGSTAGDGPLPVTVAFVVQSVLLHDETSSSAIAERARCRVGQFWLKVEDWERETILADIIGLSSTTATKLVCKAIEFGDKT